MQLIKAGNTITTLDEWFQWAPPKGGADQWVNGRSAKEFARACCESPTIISEIEQLVDSNPATRGVRLVSGEPECQIRFDRIPGEPRNADLAVVAEGPTGRFAITIEAKADEAFGERIADVLAAAIERELSHGASGGVTRVQQLAHALLEARQPRAPRLGDLRYQLLTATAGTLAFAEQIHAAAAILIISEFVTPLTRSANRTRNDADLSAFARRVSSTGWDGVPDRELLGPVPLGRAPLFASAVPFYLGKITRRTHG